MSDPLYELLIPHFDIPPQRPIPSLKDPTTNAYLKRLGTLPLQSLSSNEPQALSQSTQSLQRTLQALSKRSHQSVIASSTHLSTLTVTLPALAHSTASLRDAIPKLDDAAIGFSENYNTRAQNEVLDRRRKVLLLSRNIDRLTDILDLPTLLSSAISSSSNAGVAQHSSVASASSINYAQALDLNAHIKRLHALYPGSSLITSVEKQAEAAMRDMTSSLIGSLRTNSLKLAVAMRTISWLRRVAAELDTLPSHQSIPIVASPSAGMSREGGLGSLFLVCRLANLQQVLSALDPLKELADQETLRLQNGQSQGERSTWEGGQQTEKYLKRYIEIFREQSFSIVSMFRSIFPPSTMTASEDALLKSRGAKASNDFLLPLPTALTTFPLKLVGMLEQTLKTYLPNVRDKGSRDSLLTQVLYCAGSLGRLAGDFSLLLASLVDELEDNEENEDWVDVTKKHRVLAGKLDLMVGGRESNG